MQANNGLITEQATYAELLVRDANRPEPMRCPTGLYVFINSPNSDTFL